MLRDAAPRRDDPGARAGGGLRRHRRAHRVRPRSGAPRPRREVRRLPRHGVDRLDGPRPHPRRPAARVAGAKRAARPRARHIDGRLGYFSFDAGAPITAGTWEAVQAAADVALTGAHALAEGATGGLRAVPSARPSRRRRVDGRLLLPEQRRDCGAAPARPRLRARGGARRRLPPRQRHAADLRRRAPTCCSSSLHADPQGRLSRTSSATPTSAAAVRATGPRATTRCRSARRGRASPRRSTTPAHGSTAWGPDAIVVSLGVDTYEHDPISHFRLTRDDFPRLGARIAALGRPTLFVMEGGYAVDDLGLNAVAVLTGFEAR